MKLALVLLCVLPLAFSAPAENKDFTSVLNSILGVFGLSLDQLKLVITGIASSLESDPTEAQCEAKCGPVLTSVLPGSNLLSTFCPFICKSFQTIAHQLHVHVG